VTREEGRVLIEDVATGERQLVACDLPVKVGQEIVVQGRRWPPSQRP
jgi:hypothetical protein